MCGPRIGSSLACNYKTRVEVTDSNEQSGHEKDCMSLQVNYQLCLIFVSQDRSLPLVWSKVRLQFCLNILDKVGSN